MLAKVASLTAYIGAKTTAEPEDARPTYERIATIEEDEPQLEDFFNDCRSVITKNFIEKLTAEENLADEYTIDLRVHETFNNAILPALSEELLSFFVNGIVARWLTITNPDNADYYFDQSLKKIDDIKNATTCKAFTRKLYPW